MKLTYVSVYLHFENILYYDLHVYVKHWLEHLFASVTCYNMCISALLRHHQCFSSNIVLEFCQHLQHEKVNFKILLSCLHSN